MFLDSKKNEYKNWKDNAEFSSAMKVNNLIIESLDEKTLEPLKKLLNKNKDDDGFVQMSFSVLDGTKLDQIIKKQSTDKCYVAKDLKGGVIGFVIFGAEDKIGSIDSLGVDKDFRSASSKTKDDPQRIGSTLLITACNELITTHQVKKIGVMISDDKSGEFYTKCCFTSDPDSDEDKWLSVKKGYPIFEKDFLNKSLQQQPPRPR